MKGSTQASPGLIALAIMAGAGITAYVYRQLIITTLLIAFAATVAVGLGLGTVAITLSMLRWHRRRSRLDSQPLAGVILSDEAEAEWLAGGPGYRKLQASDETLELPPIPGK